MSLNDLLAINLGHVLDGSDDKHEMKTNKKWSATFTQNLKRKSVLFENEHSLKEFHKISVFSIVQFKDLKKLISGKCLKRFISTLK